MTNKNTYNLLSQINIPADLRRLPIDKLPQVCEELRRDIIDELADNPGHFASSLGVVELTVALHYVYDTPYDRIVWDVGHQAYGHKILTGRRERFSTNRKLHGLKPFPSPSESEYDTFTCGHASNSISAALGMAVASANQDEKRRHIIAVIGDGSMSGGLAFEGLNNASSTPNDILIILNDNNMSIDRSVGGMNHYFHQLHTSSLYNRLRFAASRKLFNWGWLNEDRRKQLIRFNNSLKSLISNQQNVFEGMNIRYFGPSDGHDVIELVHTLRVLKDMKGPKLFSYTHRQRQRIQTGGEGGRHLARTGQIRQGNRRTHTDGHEQPASTLPRRFRTDLTRTGPDEPENHRGDTCHAVGMLDECPDEGDAGPGFRCRYRRRTRRHLLRWHGARRPHPVLQHLFLLCPTSL